MTVLITNFASSVTTVDITIGSNTVTVADASKFPVDAAGKFFVVVVESVLAVKEIMFCTTRTGNLLTVSRGQEGTSIGAFPIGSRCELRLTAAVIENLAIDEGTF